MSDAEARKQDTNVKDTIESILVAFILAFIFRCFVIEAFVIPTGSMAPTLLGAHMPFRCPDCGYRFTLMSVESTDTSFSIEERSRKTLSVFCPNCAYRLPREDPHDADNDATQPLLRYGDRILVMKYLYLLHAPERWDVVVFKTPAPQTDGDYSVNFIKRLVGLPGESVMVAEGDLYVAPPGADRADPKSYRIQTKPRPAQEALWRIVFDADHIPQGKPRDAYRKLNGTPLRDPPWQQPWKQTHGQGWTIDGRRFKFDGLNQSGELSFIADPAAQNAPLTDWLAYDQSSISQGEENIDTFGRDSYARSQGRQLVFPVSDLKLSCVIDRLEGNGVLSLVLVKGHDRFTAEIAANSVRLIRRNSSGEATELARAPINLRRSTRVAFENVDYRVALRIDDKEVLATTPEQYAPDVAAVIDRVQRGETLKGQVQILADNVRTELSHVQLWRDVYYLDHGYPRDVRQGRSRNFPNEVATLGPKEYFVLGDNSFQSEDARYWSAEVNLPEEQLVVEAGRVPDRFMLGKAFFVYWPAGFRPAGSLPPLIPNFGEMRLIR